MTVLLIMYACCHNKKKIFDGHLTQECFKLYEIIFSSAIFLDLSFNESQMYLFVFVFVCVFVYFSLVFLNVLLLLNSIRQK